jgi:hypothetical protein
MWMLIVICIMVLFEDDNVDGDLCYGVDVSDDGVDNMDVL